MRAKIRYISKPLLVFCLIAGLLLGGIPTAYAADATVYDEVELRAALAAPGDTHNITLGADITTADGIYISGKTVNFNLGEFDLNIVAADDALSAANATVTINGTTGTLNVQGGHYGVLATGTSSVTVTNAKVTDTAAEADAVRAQDDSDIVVKGNVVAEGSADGVTAIQAGSSVIVEGNITSANGTGAVARYGAVIDITGNVNATGGQGLLSDNGVINIHGDVAAPSGCGACAYNSGSGTGNAQILIDGTITADTYVRLGITDKGITDTVPTTKLSYHTYNENGFTVWVKDAGGGISASPVSLPSSGGNSVVTITGAELPNDITVTAFDGNAPTSITGTTEGNEEEQTVTLSFPSNPAFSENKVYIIRASLDGSMTWSDLSTTVTMEPLWPGAVCRIGNTPYYSLADAFTAAVDYDEIVLLEDIKLDSTFTVSGTQTNYLHLSSHTIEIEAASGAGLIVEGCDIRVSTGATGSFDVTGETYGIEVLDGGSVNVTSVTATAPDGVGVYADGGNVEVANNVTAMQEECTGVWAYDGGKVSVQGSVLGGKFGIRADLAESLVVVDGDVTAPREHGVGVWVNDGGAAMVGGSVEGYGYAACASQYGEIDIHGDATATSENGLAAVSNSGAAIKIGGDALGSWGVKATDPGSEVTVDGDVTSTGNDIYLPRSGAHAEHGGSIEIGSSIQSVQCGIFANGDNSAVFVRVGGDIIVSDAANGIGVCAVNAEDAGEKAEIIVDGTIAAHTYVKVGNMAKTQGDTLNPTTKLGYATYSEGNNTVWVKVPGAGMSAIPTSLPLAGGDSVITVAGIDLPNGITVKAFEDDAATDITGTTEGNDTQQSITLSFPANAGGVDKVYTVKASLDGGLSWSELTAVVTVAKRSSGGGGGGGGGSVPAYNAVIKRGNTQSTLPVAVNAKNASVNLGSLAGELFGEDETIVNMPSVPGVNSFTLKLPAGSLSGSENEGLLTFTTDIGSIAIPDNMLSGMQQADGKQVGITIGEGDKSSLPASVKAAIGSRPLIRLTLTLDGAQADWSNSAAPVTVSIPYTPTTEERNNPESIIVWYIDGSGNAVSVPNGRYDPETATVTFTTDHFSIYAITYNKVSFNDVAQDAWYYEAVSFIAARGVTTGTGDGHYSPDMKLTRGQFIVLLMRAYGIAPDLNPADNFTDAGNTYYTDYLATAKRLGISNGVGNNLFAPGKEITRQEMFTLLYNVLKLLDKLPQGDSGKALFDFSDAGLIAPWAKDAMELLVETGIISGSGSRLFPTDTTTRAQMAQVLYNLLIR